MGGICYESVREKMASGDVILWKGNGLISWLIRRFTEFSHASLVLRLKEFRGLKDRRFLVEALGSGVDLRLLSRRLRGYDGEAWWFPLKSEYREKRSAIVAWALNQVGKPYDYGSLFKNILGRVNEDVNAYFCSELVFSSFKHAGLVCGVKAPRPGDIARWKCLGEPVRIYLSDRKENDA